jgi:protease IV
MAKFQDYLKNIFWLLLILRFAAPVARSMQKQWLDHVEPKNKVGFVFLNSVIMSSSVWNKQLTKFFKDPEIKAILIKIDSPGGAAGAGEAIAQEILQLKKDHPKPIVTYAENICASAAYQIAATTDYIVTTGSALVGSIGSKLSTQFKVKEFLNNYKIEAHAYASSGYKSATDPFVDSTPEQNQMLQDLVMDGYEHFVSDIAKYRHLNLAQKNIWADGKIFTGNQALALKLVDEIGNQTTALEFIKKQILHADREIELVKIARPSVFARWMYPESDENDEDEMQESLATSFWSGLLQAVQKHQVLS